MNSMKRIESKEDMVKWAEEVNNGVTIERKCNMQDIWAHSDVKQLEKFLLELNGQRSLIIHSVYNTMSYDTVEELLKVIARDKAMKIINEEREHDFETLEERTQAVRKREELVINRENALTECLKGYWKRVKELRRQVSCLNSTVNHLQSELHKSHDARHQADTWAGTNYDKARRYDAIKQALA